MKGDSNGNPGTERNPLILQAILILTGLVVVSIAWTLLDKVAHCGKLSIVETAQLISQTVK